MAENNIIIKITGEAIMSEKIIGEAFIYNRERIISTKQRHQQKHISKGLLQLWEYLSPL